MDSGILADMLDQPSLPGHVYLHVPFCRSKCAYCDFASIEAPSSRLTIAVFRALEAEVRRWGTASLPGVVETVYVGGGTPSLYADQVARLLRRVVRRAAACATAPRSPSRRTPTRSTRRRLARIADAGANRISVGVQTLNDAELQLLGRVHSAWQAREALRIAQGLLPEVSADLICGIPGQTLDSWLTTVAEIASSGVTHVSVYPLVGRGRDAAGRARGRGTRARARPRYRGGHDARRRRHLRASGARCATRSPTTRGRGASRSTTWGTGPVTSTPGIGPGAHSMYTAGRPHGP